MSISSDNDSELDTSVNEEEGSSNDGYSDDGFDYRYYCNPIMRYIPKEKRSYVRKICKDTARVHVGDEPVKRKVQHYLIVQEKTETCMEENCNELTTGKCVRCHAFLCIDSENDCFTKFHDYY